MRSEIIKTYAIIASHLNYIYSKGEDQNLKKNILHEVKECIRTNSKKAEFLKDYISSYFIIMEETRNLKNGKLEPWFDETVLSDRIHQIVILPTTEEGQKSAERILSDLPTQSGKMMTFNYLSKIRSINKLILMNY
mgnify:CR=1 FL=1